MAETFYVIMGGDAGDQKLSFHLPNTTIFLSHSIRGGGGGGGKERMNGG